MVWESFFILLAAVVSPSLCTYGCPPFNQSGEPRFTKTLAKADAVTIHHYIPILCCAGGVDSIIWYRLEQGNWNMFPWPDYSFARLESQTNQTLEITSTDDRDNTQFKCVLVKDGVPVLENILQLHVVRCDDLPKGPIVTEPYPVNPIIENYGETVTIPCTGYFGCAADESDKFFRDVEWEIKGARKKNISKINRRYVTSSVISPGGDLISSNLTIKSVQPGDLERTFICHLSSPQVHNGQKEVDIRIMKKDKLNYALIIGVCSAVLVVIILAIVIYYLIRRYYGPQIRVYMSSRFKRLAKKPINGEGFEYNAFIYHASDDTSTAQRVKQKLEEHMFNTKMSDDVLGYEMELAAIDGEIKKSFMVLFLYSQNLREDNLANIVLMSLIHNRQEKNIIFIEIDDFNTEEVLNWAKDAKNDNTKLKEEDKLEEDGHKDCPGNKDNNTIDMKFWKFLPRFKYPKNTASERQIEHFWCSLYNTIPRFEHQVQKKELLRKTSSNKRSCKGRNSSSTTTPLLESPSQSPTWIDNQGQDDSTPKTEMTPPFRYDEEFIRRRNEAQNNNANVENDPDASVLVNVDVHEPREFQIRMHDEIEDGTSDGQDPEVGGDKIPLSAKSSNSDTVFTLSGEELNPRANNNETCFLQTQPDISSENNITGRNHPSFVSESSVGTADSDMTSDPLAQNRYLHVEIRGNKSPQSGSLSSPESGYTSISPPMNVEDSGEWARKQIDRMQNNQVQNVL